MALDGAPRDRGLLDRLDTVGGRRALGYAALLLGALLALAVAAATLSLAPEGQPGSVRGVDFSSFWAAARVALEQGPIAPLDPDILVVEQRHDIYLPYLHPALWLAMILPLGLVPYAVAYPAFVAVSTGLFAAALALMGREGVEGPRRRAILVMLALACPMVLFGAYVGQMLSVWAAILIAAFAALERGRPWLAGLLIGLLSIKPTLCLLLPLAFLAAREWRVIAGATLSLALSVGLPTLWTGVGYWPVWIDAMALQGGLLAKNTDAMHAMVSWYACLRGLGLGHEAALQGGLVVALGCAAAVWRTWSRPDVSWSARFAVFCAAAPLTTPYAWYYALIVTTVGVLYLIRDGWGHGRAAWALVAVVWAAGPMLAMPGEVVEFRLVYAPVATLVLLATLAQAGVLTTRRTAPAVAGE